MQSSLGEKITLNVSGETYETYKTTLRRYPGTVLADLDKTSPFYDKSMDQYVFVRSRLSFGPILFFYQSRGILSRPRDVSRDNFIKECQFFRLPRDKIENLRKINDRIEDEEIEAEIEEERKLADQHSFCSCLWRMMEHPESSWLSKIYMLVSCGMILFSVVAACLESKSYPGFDKSTYKIMEFSAAAWFAFEFLVRLFVWPGKKNFFKNALNLIDVAVMIPYLVVALIRGRCLHIGFLRTFRLIAFLRLIDPKAYKKFVRIVADVITSWAFQNIFVFLIVTVTFGGSAMFYIAEFAHDMQEVGVRDHHDHHEQLYYDNDGHMGFQTYQSIPEAMWWAVITVTTVGYGDYFPDTVYERLFSMLYIVCGTIVIILPLFSVQVPGTDDDN